ncbi:class I SAM-dependent methyltransferase [Streptomyces sp. NPDC059122]|uniref:class I SAM-dependent methyltransferase n=1 Tax=Streptomyces sp. NPDC059122 TaxID=3346732 RepID=UPI0036B72AF2
MTNHEVASATRSSAAGDGVQRYYAEFAGALAERYESVTFEEVHGEVLHLLPAAPARAADIGSGTGRDAAALARRGYEVVAVEPVAALREVAGRLHADVPVAWRTGALPDLESLAGGLDLILVSAVWMHLGADQRPAAMRRLGELLAPAGRLVLSLRHGTPPADRRMYDVSGGETAALAERCGLRVRHLSGDGADCLGRTDVHWSHLVLEKPAEGEQ